MAKRLSRGLGHNMVVENISGGGGLVASQTVQRATPDGYTLMLAYVATHSTSLKEFVAHAKQNVGKISDG